MTIPYQVFQDGDVFTPELANLAFSSPVFDGNLTLLGHRNKIQDSELSDTGLKLSFNTVANGLLCSIQSGLTVAYSAGSVRLPNGGVQAISGGAIAVQDGVGYVFVNPLGVVQYAAKLPAVCVPMATVTAAAGSISNISDLRNIGNRLVLPQTNIIKCLGGSNTEDYVAVNGAVLNQGIYYYRNFTVPAGVSISVVNQATIICSGDVNIAGTVVVTPITAGGNNMPINLTANEFVGGSIGQGLGGTGSVYPWGVQSYGSGGSGAAAFCPSGTTPYHCENGGTGGGSLIVEAAGTITVSGLITCNGTNGGRPSSTGGFPAGGGFYTFTYGSATNPIVSTGSGGGSGGFVRLASVVSVTITGNISCNGGNGGNGLANSPSTAAVGCAGCGGGGGVIVLMSPTISNTGTVQALGGTRGTPGLAGAWSQVGDVFSLTGTTLFAVGGVGGLGGGFGGASGFWSTSSAAGITSVSYTPSQNGQVIQRLFLPVG